MYLGGERFVRVEVFGAGDSSAVGLVDDVAEERDGGRRIDSWWRLPP